jgi:hypothetical protein
MAPRTGFSDFDGGVGRAGKRERFQRILANSFAQKKDSRLTVRRSDGKFKQGKKGFGYSSQGSGDDSLTIFEQAAGRRI